MKKEDLYSKKQQIHHSPSVDMDQFKEALYSPVKTVETG